MVTVKIIGVPGQPLRVGVTVIVPVMLAPVLFAGAVHDVIFPLPLAPSPIAVFVLTQANVAPDGILAKFPMLIAAPGHTAIFGFCVTTGVG